MRTPRKCYVLLFAVSLPGSISCSADSHGDAVTPPMSQPDRSCDRATVGGVSITWSDIEYVRAAVRPPPTEEEALRLAVAATALSLREPTIDTPTIATRLRRYRALIVEGSAIEAALPAQVAYFSACGGAQRGGL